MRLAKIANMQLISSIWRATILSFLFGKTYLKVAHGRLSLGICVVALTFFVGGVLHGDTRFLKDDYLVAPFQIFRDCEECPEMIVLPLGSFIMGAPLEESAFLHSLWVKPEKGIQPGFEREGPQHKVEVDIPVAMGRNEVTREEWLACVAETVCKHKPDPSLLANFRLVEADNPRHPVMDVSFYDALEYVEWLNTKVGAKVYRLPTEAEWEYAARAGTQTKFAQGDKITTDEANFTAYHWEGDHFAAKPNKIGMPLPVDALNAANSWGLRHMSGNVSEWTLSCLTNRHLGRATTSSYLKAVKMSPPCRRVIKGGTYAGYEDYLRPAWRASGNETRRSSQYGFRVIRKLGK